MAFSTLSLSTITGVQGRPYRAVLSGLQADSRIEIGGDGSPGFSYVNGRFSSEGLPYPVSTLVFDEIRPGEGRKQWRFDISAAGAPVASVATDGTITYTGAGGGAPTAQAGTASNAGPVYTIARLLGSTSSLSLITGTNSNLTLNATTGVISATAAIAVGASQTAVVSETNGSLRVDYPVVVTGVSATPTPSPTPAPTPTPGFSAFTFEPETTAYIAAANTAGSPIPTLRQRDFNRYIEVLKKTVDNRGNAMQSIWSRLMASPNNRLHVGHGTEPNILLNVMTPGTNSATKVGTPTYTEDLGFTSGSVNNRYNTNVVGSSANPVFHMGMFTHLGPATASAGIDCGWYDRTSGGMSLTARDSTGALVYRALSPLTKSVSTTHFSGDGYTAMDRRTDGTVDLYHHGKLIESQTPTYVAPTGTDFISFGGAAGVGTASAARTFCAFAFIEGGLTTEQAEIFAAATREYVSNAVRYGSYAYEPVGRGTQTIDKDYVIYGGSMPAYIAAIRLAAEGKSVAMIGDEWMETPGQLGGHMGDGHLTYLDTTVFDNTAVSGLFRDIESACNTIFYNSSDANDQINMSPEPRALIAMLRRAMDPTKTGGVLSGRNIPVYLTGGAKSVVVTGNKITGLTTRDGRAFTFRQLIGADYAGNLLPMLPRIARISGVEAPGTNGETAWYNPLSVKKPTGGGGAKNIDPYVIPGDSTSGRISGVSIIDPAITATSADPYPQQLSTRLSVTTSAGRFVDWMKMRRDPLSITPDEFLGRWCAADSSLAFNFNIGAQRATKTGFDQNSGTGFPILELPASGKKMLDAAIADGTGPITNQIAVFKELSAWHIQTNIWCRESTDPRRPNAPSVRSQAITYSPDATQSLDPPSWSQLNFPGRPYLRNGHFRMVNQVVKPFNADDIVNTPDGTPVRPNGRAACNMAYTLDDHAKDLVISGGVVQQRGSVSFGSTAGGANGVTGIAYDHFIPDAGTYDNFSYVTAPSMSQGGWSGTRLEPALCMAMEFVSVAHMVAQETGVSMQAVDYATVKTRAQNLALSGGTSQLVLNPAP